jgi:pimeloyl-ACP methyl ester carboxylesterase
LLGVGGTFGGGGDSEQRSEGVEGIIPPVEAEDEFVEISLQVLLAHPVMGPDQPGLEIGKNAVDDGKKGFGDRLPPDAFKICVEDELRVAEPAWRWWLERGSRDDISAATGEIDFPALVIAGDDDRVLGPDTAPAIAPMPATSYRSNARLLSRRWSANSLSVWAHERDQHRRLTPFRAPAAAQSDL